MNSKEKAGEETLPVRFFMLLIKKKKVFTRNANRGIISFKKGARGMASVGNNNPTMKETLTSFCESPSKPLPSHETIKAVANARNGIGLSCEL